MKPDASLPVDEIDRLQDRYWPPVGSFAGLDRGLETFVALSVPEQKAFLAQSGAAGEAHGRTVHGYLSQVYAYLFGYRDGPCTARADDDLEAALMSAKIVLERELLDGCLGAAPVPAHVRSQADACAHLQQLVDANSGVRHELFDYVADAAPVAAVDTFLRCELVRNEVVDDEVAMLVVGLQGAMKAVAAGNLWDECGHGRLAGFHTFWLRQLLEATDGWEALVEYRARDLPWFAGITSNLNAMLLSRPAYRFMAYGCFLAFESWVEPHFRRIIRGMERVGPAHPDARRYFSSHVRIDPLHTEALLDGIRRQRPELLPDEVTQVVRGAHLGVAAGTAQFDRMLPYLRSLC